MLDVLNLIVISAPQNDKLFDAEAFLLNQPAEDNKRILLSAFHQYPDALGALLEILERTYEAGYEVFVGLWADQIRVADTCNSYSIFLRKIFRSKSPQQEVAEIISQYFPRVKFIDLQKSRKPKRYFFPNKNKVHVNFIQNSYPENPGKGYAIGASLIDGTRRSVATASFNKSLVRKFSFSYDEVCKSAIKVLKQNEIDTVILFNGRRTHDHALVSASKLAGINYLNYEVGGSDGRFDLYQHGTHDRFALQKRMVESFNKNLSQGSVNIAKEWFERRRFRQDVIGAMYSAKQKTGVGLEFKHANSTKIGFYSSSTDELASVGVGWESPFGEQEDSISLIAHEVENNPKIELVVRTHPNMRNKSKLTKKRWNDFINQLPIDFHVDSESEIDSYSLLEQLDGVIVHGSTIGIEAAFWGKPVLSMAPNFYDQLGCASIATSPEDVINWIKDIPEQINSERALPYGFFARVRGIPFNFYKQDNGLHGKFRDSSIGIKNKYLRLIFEIENRLRRVTW